jgi:DNA-binding transcriptional LysR family regulator
MLEQLLQGRLDFFIAGHLEQPERPQRVQSEAFASVPLLYYVREGHPLLEEPEVTPRLIARYPRFAGSTFAERIAREDDEILRYLRPTLTMDNFDLLTQFTIEYDGVLASFVGGARDPRLRPLDFDLHGLLGSSTTFLYSLEGIRLSRMGQLVVGDLRHALARLRSAARSL